MCFLPLKSSHYPSRPVPVPELFGKYPTRPVPKSKTPTRQTLIMVLSHPLRAAVILDLFGAFGQERIDTLMFLTKASEDEIRGVGGGLDPGTVRAG